MARLFSPELESAINAGTVVFRYGVEIHLNQKYYFGNHTAGEYLTYEGNQYYGLGALASISDLTTSSGMAASQGTVELDGALLTAPPEGYENVASWFRTLLQNNLINRRIVIHEIYESTETGEVIGGYRITAGRIDKTPLDLKSPTLTVRYRSNRGRLTWGNGRTRTDADQRQINPNDGSLRHVGKTSARKGKLAWGFAGNNSAPGGTSGQPFSNFRTNLR